MTRAQLLNGGIRPDTIKYRVRSGRLIPVYAGVYAVGHLPTLPLDRAHGALLACGPEAVLSHRSAATVWGIFSEWRWPLEVTAPGRRRRPGIIVHRNALVRRDVTRNLGIRVTSAARTALDMAPRLGGRRVPRAVDDLRRRGHLSIEQLAELLARCPSHPGTKLLLALVQAPHGPTRSDFEVAFLEFVKRYELSEPLINVQIAGYEVDAFFPLERVIVELDGWDFHSGRGSFRSDRERDAHMLALGLPTVRITWDRLTEAPEREARRLRTILGRRSARTA